MLQQQKEIEWSNGLIIKKKEAGFYLPYALVVALISLSLLLTMTQVYLHEIEIAHNVTEQLEVETLVQMGKAKLTEELRLEDFKGGHIEYDFPNGKNKIIYIGLIDEHVNVHYNIVTKNNFLITLPGIIRIEAFKQETNHLE